VYFYRHTVTDVHVDHDLISAISQNDNCRMQLNCNILERK